MTQTTTFSHLSPIVAGQYGPSAVVPMDGVDGVTGRTSFEALGISVTPQQYGGRGDYVTGGGVGVGTDNSAAFTAALTYLGTLPNGGLLRVPAGSYKILSPLVWPDNVGIELDRGAQLVYFDVTVPGSYLLTNGATGLRHGGISSRNLYIVFGTGTAKGIDLFNSFGDTFEGLTYIEGFIPADWAVNPAAVNARTNTGVRVRADVGGWFNLWERLQFNHCHFGFTSDNEGLTTQHIFNWLSLYGDALYGDTTSIGMDINSCGYSVIKSGWCESYGAAGYGFRFRGPNARGWKVAGMIFDSVTTAVRFDTTGGYPTDNIFDASCQLFGAAVVSGALPNGNCWVETGPDIPFTVTATPLTSGTITLTPGDDGNQGYMTQVGNHIHLTLSLTVQSVVAPVGRLIFNLPVFAAGGVPVAKRIHAVSVYAYGLTADATNPPLIAYLNPGATQTIEVSKLVAGAAANLAGDVKAGTYFVLTVDYISVPMS